MNNAVRDFGYKFGLSVVSTGFSLPHIVENYSYWSSLRELVHRLRINCVIDVGANRGQFASRLRMSGYAGHILSFEPNPDAFRFLQESCSKDKLWKSFNIALGSSNTTQAFNITSSSYLSSFFDPIESASSSAPELGTSVERTELIDIKRLDSMLDELLENINEPRIFLKSDTQGYDLEVIKGTASCIDRILGLLSEVSVSPLYRDVPHYLDSLRHYESLGFSLMDLFVVNRTKYKSVLEYDCLMARTDRLQA